MTELAVRLGGIQTFDRTGNVIFFDDFSAGLANWEHSSFPADAYAVPTASYFSIKPYSIKMAATTDAGSYTGITRGLPIPYLSRMGLEFHLKVTATLDRFICYMYCYDGTYRYTIQLELDKSEDGIFIFDGSLGLQKVCDYNLQTGSNAPFHIFKIVFDLTTEYHFRLVIDEADYDLSSYSIYKVANTTNPYFYMCFMTWPFDSKAQKVYLDNIILTIDEPQ